MALIWLKTITISEIKRSWNKNKNKWKTCSPCADYSRIFTGKSWASSPSMIFQKSQLPPINKGGSHFGVICWGFIPWCKKKGLVIRTLIISLLINFIQNQR